MLFQNHQVAVVVAVAGFNAGVGAEVDKDEAVVEAGVIIDVETGDAGVGAGFGVGVGSVVGAEA